MVSYWPGPVGLWYSPREVCTSVARGTLTVRDEEDAEGEIAEDVVEEEII